VLDTSFDPATHTLNGRILEVDHNLSLQPDIAGAVYRITGTITGTDLSDTEPAYYNPDNSVIINRNYINNIPDYDATRIHLIIVARNNSGTYTESEFALSNISIHHNNFNFQNVNN